MVSFECKAPLLNRAGSVGNWRDVVGEAAPLQSLDCRKKWKMDKRSRMSMHESRIKPKRVTVIMLLKKAEHREQHLQQLEVQQRQKLTRKISGASLNADGDSEEESSDDEEEPETFTRERNGRGAVRDVEVSKALRVVVDQEGHGFFEQKETDRLKKVLMRAGDGFALRGWRRKFDNEGNLEISFAHFCKVSVDMGFVRRSADLYAIPREFTNITLVHVNPHLGGLLESFRRWLTLKYHGHANFFYNFDLSGATTISPEDFFESCHKEGFSATERELGEIFACCDWEGHGVITRDDVVFLETYATVRNRELLQIKKRKQYEFDKVLIDHYSREMNAERLGHRQAMRPWIAGLFEVMPEIQRQRRVMNEKTRVRRGCECRLDFIRHIRRLNGNEVMAWRRLLDVDAKFEVPEIRFRKFCRHIDFHGDLNALWYNFDPDHDGTLSLQQIAPQGADLLASFRKWVVEEFGSCVAVWEHPGALAARKKAHPNRDATLIPNMSISAFAQFLKMHRCPMIEGADGKTTRWWICKCLDFNGCGFLCRSDMEWLDKWEPAEWLTTQPDEDAWRELSKLLVQRYGHLLKAWRFGLDVDKSGRLSWIEFRDACQKVEFTGCMGGAWRFLDKDLLGWVRLGAVDEESSEILHSFKEWAETRFGTVELAFKAIGGGNANGAFTYHEMRIACSKFKWIGDARLLFDCLTKNGETVSFKDASFLGAWYGLDQENNHLFKATNETLWAEMLDTCPAVLKKSSLAVSEGVTVERAPQNQRQPGDAWGEGPMAAQRPQLSKVSLVELLESLEEEELADSTRHGKSISSLPDTMYTVPECHCCPRAAFLGAPYSRPVVAPIKPVRQARKPPATNKLVKSSSQPSFSAKPKSSYTRMGNFSKNGNRASGPSRKRDIIGSSALNQELQWTLEDS